MRSLVVRLFFTLLVAADAFGNSFLPVYAHTLDTAPSGLLAWLGADMAAGLPVSIFWFMVAVAQISTGVWERGRNHRHLFTIATLLTAAGLALSGVAQDAFQLILGRAISGLGYGAVMILTQDHLLRVMGPAARTRASGLYFSLFFTGAIAGTLSGGVLASHIGYAATLLAGAGLATIAAALALFSDSHVEAAAPEPLRCAPLLRNGRLLGLVTFGAIPSRLVNGAFIFYLIPLYLHDQGAVQSTVGWVVMIYSLILATTTTFWSWLVDSVGRPVLFSVVGVVLSALAMALIPLGWSGLWGAVAATALLGTAQAVGMSPQVTVLFRVTTAEMERFGRTPLLGIFRVAERIGLFAGPMVAAWLISSQDYQAALVALTAMMGVSAIALVVVFALFDRHGPAVPALEEPETPTA